MCDNGDCTTFGHVYRGGVCVMCGAKEPQEDKRMKNQFNRVVVMVMMLISLLGVGVINAQVDVESVVRVAEAEIAGLPYEVVIVFNASTGAEIFRKNGGADGIGLTRDEALRAKGAIMTHNHPAGNAVFSLNDLQLGEYVNVRQLRVVAPNLARCVVTRPSHAIAWRGAFLYNDEHRETTLWRNREANYTALVRKFGGERAYQANVFTRWGWAYRCG